MWLARLFGAASTDDSEPSQFPPQSVASEVRQRRAAPGVASRTTHKTKGFDPYNSGAFRKSSAWERVHRR